ncbi:hypothetical protein EMCRGX_G034824 [Ephydatia muelleri]
MVQLVKREGNKWVSVYGIDGVLSVPAHTSACPLNYCKDIEIVSLIRPGELCNGGRIGILSGHCPSGQSVVFGSPECQLCSNMWRMTILMYAVFEAFFTGCCVFMLNMTVMQGTLYRLIFYANIIQVNATVFFNPSILSPLEIIISFINLDLLCFYDGMDDATKAGLQFVFSVYLLIFTITVIVVCYYCLNHSPTQNRQCFDKVSYIVGGQRAVGVLSTLIYLSYSKLLRTVIDIFTYSMLHIPDGSVLVCNGVEKIYLVHSAKAATTPTLEVTCISYEVANVSGHVTSQTSGRPDFQVAIVTPSGHCHQSVIELQALTLMEFEPPSKIFEDAV